VKWRAISFMNHPPPVIPPSVNNRLSVALVQKKMVDVNAKKSAPSAPGSD
jgi:hypothetical protein